MRILIIGAGICGSSLARAAQAAGHEVTVVDDHLACDSLAAAAVLRRAWHTGGERALFNRTMALYRQWGVPVTSGAVVTSYRREDVRTDPDWHLVDPSAPLWTSVTPGHAVALDHGISLGDTRIDADHVLWATGRHRGEVSGVTFGVTWVHPDPVIGLGTPETLRVHHCAPYKTMIAGVAGATARFGSSSASSIAKAREQANSMLAEANRLGMITDMANWSPREGIRVKSAPAATLGGMHRTGYALAPALAERLIGALA